MSSPIHFRCGPEKGRSSISLGRAHSRSGPSLEPSIFEGSNSEKPLGDSVYCDRAFSFENRESLLRIDAELLAGRYFMDPFHSFGRVGNSMDEDPLTAHYPGSIDYLFFRFSLLELRSSDSIPWERALHSSFTGQNRHWGLCLRQTVALIPSWQNLWSPGRSRFYQRLSKFAISLGRLCRRFVLLSIGDESGKDSNDVAVNHCFLLGKGYAADSRSRVGAYARESQPALNVPRNRF